MSDYKTFVAVPGLFPISGPQKPDGFGTPGTASKFYAAHEQSGAVDWRIFEGPEVK